MTITFALTWIEFAIQDAEAMRDEALREWETKLAKARKPERRVKPSVRPRHG